MSAPQLSSSAPYSESDSGYQADSSAPASPSTVHVAIPDGFGVPRAESEDWPSSDSDRSIWGRNVLNRDASVSPSVAEEEEEYESAYEAEEGGRSGSSSEEEDSSSRKSVSAEEMGDVADSSSSSSSSEEEEEEPEDKTVEDSQTASRGVKRGREDDAEGSSKRARAA
ncbi:hypothetical protein E2P81_ATG09727 [Venturia nashicola]|nr:hypothetical protein E2P81_ATG09727 [Venturia nashicola]